MHNISPCRACTDVLDTVSPYLCAFIPSLLWKVFLLNFIFSVKIYLKDSFTYFFSYFFFNLQSYEFLPLQGPEGLRFSSICLLLDLVTTISLYTAQGKEP